MAIEKGESNSMFNYAYMLKNGDGIPMNKEEAIKYFKMAIDKGHSNVGNSDAMYNYAVILYLADGIQMNKNEAMRYFQLAAFKGNQNAMHILMSMSSWLNKLSK